MLELINNLNYLKMWNNDGIVRYTIDGRQLELFILKISTHCYVYLSIFRYLIIQI